jgi:hypothetical protein
MISQSTLLIGPMETCLHKLSGIAMYSQGAWKRVLPAGAGLDGIVYAMHLAVSKQVIALNSIVCV